MTTRDYSRFVQDILESISDIEGFVQDMSYNEFVNDKKMIKAVV